MKGEGWWSTRRSSCGTIAYAIAAYCTHTPSYVTRIRRVRYSCRLPPYTLLRCLVHLAIPSPYAMPGTDRNYAATSLLRYLRTPSYAVAPYIPCPLSGNSFGYAATVSGTDMGCTDMNWAMLLPRQVLTHELCCYQ
eukprot:2092160-Rhodomonas_salina.1